MAKNIIDSSVSNKPKTGIHQIMLSLDSDNYYRYMNLKSRHIIRRGFMSRLLNEALATKFEELRHRDVDKTVDMSGT